MAGQYDEFAFLRGNAEEAGLIWKGPPAVARHFVDVGGRVLVNEAIALREPVDQTVLFPRDALNVVVGELRPL